MYFRNFLAYCLQLFDTASVLEAEESLKFQTMVSTMDAVIKAHTQQLIDVHTKQICYAILPDIDKVHDAATSQVLPGLVCLLFVCFVFVCVVLYNLPWLWFIA